MVGSSLVVSVRRKKGKWRWTAEVDGVRRFRSAKGFSEMWRCERDAMRSLGRAWSWFEGHHLEGRSRWDMPEDALRIKWDESARAGGRRF